MYASCNAGFGASAPKKGVIHKIGAVAGDGKAVLRRHETLGILVFYHLRCGGPPQQPHAYLCAGGTKLDQPPHSPVESRSVPAAWD